MGIEDESANVRRFIKLLQTNIGVHTQLFYDFFEVPEEYRSSSGGSRRTTEISFTEEIDLSELGEKRSTFTFPSSAGHHWTEFTDIDTREFCLYFLISLVSMIREDDHQMYIFEIESRINPELKFQIEKRYSDFPVLATQLKLCTASRPPSLPQKILLMKTVDKYHERGKYLSNWLQIVCNEKGFLWDCLFEFLELPRSEWAIHQNIKPLAFLERNYTLDTSISGHETIMQEGESFTVFCINIDVVFNGLQNIVTGYEIKRRFNEFICLHQGLKKRFEKYKQPLPDLPSKIAIGSIESRQFKLESFLRLLIKYPDIYDSILFRKFLEINPNRFNEFKLKKMYRGESGSQE